MSDAQVACRMAGFIGAESYYIDGQGTGGIILSDVDCYGQEGSLFECGYPGFYSHGCDHTQDIGVICNRWGGRYDSSAAK